MNYTFTPPPVPSVAIAGHDEEFPVHRIYCIGRNYSAHAIEMGGNPDRDPPFFFFKPADTLVANGADVPYPPATHNFHYEIEMVVAIDKECVAVSVADALNYVFGYGVGIDLTRRDLQLQARENGRPWDISKGFDFSAPCTALHTVDKIGHPDSGAIWLKVNGETRQSSNIAKLIWSVAEQISVLSHYFTLLPGDLVFTGTPEGVGAIVKGDVVTGGVDGIDEICITIV